MKMKTFSLILCILMLLSIVSCSDVKISRLDPIEPSSPAPELQKYDNVETALSYLGLRLLDYFVESEDNIMISPFSLMQAFGMCEEGADGTTKDEIQNVVFSGLDLQAYKNVLNDKNFKYCLGDINIANSAWVNTDLEEEVKIYDMYKNTVESQYGAGIYDVSFNDSSTANRINNWVSDKTNKKVKKIVNISDLTNDKPMILVNTIYFASKWSEEFEKLETPLKFKNADSSIVDVPNLQDNRHSQYVCIDGRDAFIKHYDNAFEYVGILPKENETIQDLIKSINPESIGNKRVWDTLGYNELHLNFPAYSFDFDADLEKPLRWLGLNLSFSDNANFSKISTYPLKVTSVIHKTNIDLDEEGTTAAAVTEVDFSMTGAAGRPSDLKIKELTFDRPFLFAIMTYDDKVFFMGVVNNLK